MLKLGVSLYNESSVFAMMCSSQIHELLATDFEVFFLSLIEGLHNQRADISEIAKFCDFARINRGTLEIENQS
jgi:hypothetical protein